MLASRLIPCLDVKDGRVVKGVKFQRLRDAGDPVAQATLYQDQGADEIVILDVSATPEGRGNAVRTTSDVRQALSIPLTVGGGVRTVDDAGALLEAGADKVSVNTAAVERPGLLHDLAETFGSQCTVLAIDAAETAPGEWEVLINGGRERTGLKVTEWAAAAEQLGAGEILLTSWDRDGTRSGYDLDLIGSVTGAVNIPVVASGGADNANHLVAALSSGADAVLMASILHDGDSTVTTLKRQLRDSGAEVRP